VCITYARSPLRDYLVLHVRLPIVLFFARVCYPGLLTTSNGAGAMSSGRSATGRETAKRQRRTGSTTDNHSYPSLRRTAGAR
jgi:hypothetical protein